MTPLKIVIVGPALQNLGGVANYVNALMRHSDHNQVHFTLVEVGKNHHSSRMGNRPLEYISSAVRLVRALIRTKPDLIHFNPSLNCRSLSLYSILLFCAKLFSRAAMLVFFRGWDERIAATLTKPGLMNRILRLMLKMTDQILVLADSFKRALIAGGITEERISISSVMVATEKFAFQTHHASKNGMPFQVLFLSRIVREKGIWELLAAAQWLAEKAPASAIHFIIAGDGPERAAVQRYVATQGWRDRFRFTGFVQGSTKHELYQQADLFVFPTSYPEGFPNVIVEALAAGLPIIYTPVGALREVLSPENGIMIENDRLNGERLAQAICELHRNSDRRKQMSIANRKLAQQKYDVAHVCSQMVTTYRDILQKRRSKTSNAAN